MHRTFVLKQDEMRYKKADKFFDNLPEWVQWLFRILVIAAIIYTFWLS